MLRARLAGGVPSAPASSPSPTLAPASHGFPRTTILLTAVRLPSSTPRVTAASLPWYSHAHAWGGGWIKSTAPPCVGFTQPCASNRRDSEQLGVRLAAASAGNDSPERSPYLRRTICATPPTAPPSPFNATRHPGGSRHARGSSTSLLLGARPSSRWSRIGVSTVRAPGHASTDTARRRSSRTTPHPLAQAAKRSGQDCGPGDQRGFASASAGD